FRNSHEGIERKRKLFTAYVSIMLLAFVGRTTLRNYLYNDSARDLNTHNYVAAKKKLDLATNIDGGFSYGWDRLARVEFRTNDSENAERHWLLALKKKPDLVSAKVGLSSIYMKSGQYEKAKILLNSARRLAPRDIATLINLGHINLVLGKKDCAIENFNKAVTLSGGDVTVCKAVTNALYQADISDYKKKQK
ncbi:MAG: hypothetical protein K8F91_21855, partial [Candidatus Obscuribacterales bacterium]|nr:hypothetical protein [Candidatus Obscuribacterales bacterium]